MFGGASRSVRVLLLLGLTYTTLAVDVAVDVGRDGTLAFSPPAVYAAVGDIVTFTFWPKNHSVTQVTFSEPCARPAGRAGIDSGFVPVDAPGPGTQPMALNVTTAAPLWFACMQPGHCQQGMVFAINSTPEKSFAAFLAAAMRASAPTSGADSGLGGETGAEGSASGAAETQSGIRPDGYAGGSTPGPTGIPPAVVDDGRGGSLLACARPSGALGLAAAILGLLFVP